MLVIEFLMFLIFDGLFNDGLKFLGNFKILNFKNLSFYNEKKKF